MIHRGRTGQIQAEHRGPGVSRQVIEILLQQITEPRHGRQRRRHHSCAVLLQCRLGRRSNNHRSCWLRSWCYWWWWRWSRFVEGARRDGRIELAIVQFANFARGAERVAVDLLDRRSRGSVRPLGCRFGRFGVQVFGSECTGSGDVVFGRCANAFLCLLRKM